MIRQLKLTCRGMFHCTFSNNWPKACNARKKTPVAQGRRDLLVYQRVTISKSFPTGRLSIFSSHETIIGHGPSSHLQPLWAPQLGCRWHLENSPLRENHLWEAYQPYTICIWYLYMIFVWYRYRSTTDTVYLWYICIKRISSVYLYL